MLRADVVVAQLQGLAQAQLEDALGARGEGNVALDRLLALADDLDDGGAHGLALDLHGLQGLGGDAFTLGDQAEQQVLRADVVVLETASLVLREHDDPASAVGKAFEHASPRFTGQALRRARRTPVPVDWLQPTESRGGVRALSPWAQGRGRVTVPVRHEAGARRRARREAEAEARHELSACISGSFTQKSHVIPPHQMSPTPRNVAIATPVLQHVKGCHGNYVRDWGETMLCGHTQIPCS